MSHLAKWLQRLVKIPTAFHLWCAERELRIADAPSQNPSLQEARARNLDLLSAYRRVGDFPHNTHEPTQMAPCFIDADGRRCAVAFLMHETGARTKAQTIAREANFARIGEMHFAELETWASGSGLSQAELARIQPAYPPTPEQVRLYGEMLWILSVFGSMASFSILFNLGRLILAYRPRLTTSLVGIAVGVFLLLYAWMRIDEGNFLLRGASLFETVGNIKIACLGLGFLSIVCAIIPLCVRRGKWQPIMGESEPIRKREPSAEERIKEGEPPWTPTDQRIQ